MHSSISCGAWTTLPIACDEANIMKGRNPPDLIDVLGTIINHDDPKFFELS
jgi:hypothetical protein